MITTLILNEIKHNLLSLRFVIGLLFVLIVYTGGSFIFSKKYLNEKVKDSRNQLIYQSNLETSQQGLEKLYEEGILLVKFQELSSYFTSGNESRFPKAFVIAPNAPQGASASGGMIVGGSGKNYKIENYTDFDLTFIIGIVLSFFAIVLTFDSVSRDREEGTLKQQLSNAVPRVQILLGKFVAILVLLLLAVFIGSLFSIIIFQIVIGQNVLISFPLETLLTGVLSTIYLSMFILLGLWISSSVAKSSTSLALLLVSWVILVILSPYIGGMIVQQYYPVESKQVYDEKWHSLLSTTSSETPQEYYECILEQFITQRFMELTNQAIKAESFNLFSPYGAFKQSMERFANTGLSYHKKFFQRARQYRSQLVQFIYDQDKLDQLSRHRIDLNPKIRSMSNKPVDPAIVPRFIAPSRHVSSIDIVQSLKSICYLIILNIFFFILALFQFLRMDVRQ
ncbi:MAG: ABC transporter permease subunit [Bacteroidia bacterium]|nr:ABC transporter permease subunit [Bacteroidia bacterium]